ncbi:hypothetical protein NBRC116602_22920 [Hyphomicrobiales bacterium 4NK60-0047b]
MFLLFKDLVKANQKTSPTKNKPTMALANKEPVFWENENKSVKNKTRLSNRGKKAELVFHFTP